MGDFTFRSFTLTGTIPNRHWVLKARSPQQVEAVTQKILSLGWLLVSHVTFPLTFFGENFFKFWESGDRNIFIPVSHTICSSIIPYFTLSSFYFSPSVIDVNNCFLSPWHGTFHKMEKDSISSSQTCPFGSLL